MSITSKVGDAARQGFRPTRCRARQGLRFAASESNSAVAHPTDTSRGVERAKLKGRTPLNVRRWVHLFWGCGRWGGRALRACGCRAVHETCYKQQKTFTLEEAWDQALGDIASKRIFQSIGRTRTLTWARPCSGRRSTISKRFNAF